MNVLIVGGGGREHALAWKMAQSSRVRNVYVAPGNAGTAREPKVTNLRISADDLPELLKFAQGHAVDLTLIGSEVPLVLGITDLFNNAGLRCFGPSQAAAQLEGSKTFTRIFWPAITFPPPVIKALPIPTPQSRSFGSWARRWWSRPMVWRREKV